MSCNKQDANQSLSTHDVTYSGEGSDGTSILAPPIIIVKTGSQRQMQMQTSNLHIPSAITTSTATATAVSTSTSTSTSTNKRGKRPYGGIVTFVVLLLTGGLAAIFLPIETRRIALIIFTPIYCICILGYIAFLCCVNNEGEEDQYDPEPAVLREYLQKKEAKTAKRRIKQEQKLKQKQKRMQRCNNGKGGNGVSSNTSKLRRHPLTVASTLSLETDESPNQQTGIDNNIDIEASDSIHQPSQSFSQSVDMSRTLTEQSLLTTTFPNFFQEIFPGVSKNFESIEVEFHNLATKVKHRIRPPHQCHTCKTGIHGNGNGTNNGNVNGLDAISTVVCSHGHAPYHGHGIHQHHQHQHQHCHSDEFQSPQTDVENYMPDDYDYSIGADASFDTSLRTEDHDPLLLEEIPIKVNLTGKYKLVHNHNFDAFLKTQNVPMLLRKAANASKPIHTITHEDNMLRIQVDGIVRGDTTFEIGGPPAESNIRYLKFDDHVTWVDDGQAVEVRKVARNAPEGGAVELVVKRTLGNGKHNLVLSSKARFANGDESLESVQTFHRIG